MGIDSNIDDDNKLNWYHLEYPKEQYIWVGDLSGFEVVLYQDALWLLHRCGFERRLFNSAFMGNLVEMIKDHRQETCKEYMK
jgi:hypothetical protein